MATWQVHRFGDAVAVYSGAGPTVYLTDKQARAMARAINRAARSIRAEPFTRAPSLTVAGECVEPDAENRRIPRMERDGTGKAVRYGDA